MNQTLEWFFRRNFQHPAMTALQEAARFMPEAEATKVAQWAKDYVIEIGTTRTVSNRYLSAYNAEAAKLKKHEEKNAFYALSESLPSLSMKRVEEESYGERTDWRLLILSPDKKP